MSRARSGAQADDLAKLTQHTKINTTRKHYIAPSVETARRVATQRVALRQAKKNTPRKMAFRTQFQTDFKRKTLSAGAPRLMKMGTIASPWRYDAAARHALRLEKLRRPAILHYV